MANSIGRHRTLLDEYDHPVVLMSSTDYALWIARVDWFTSLSSLFLSCKTARLLVLAGTERLDRELMIGQMQGKFQLEVISGVGHMLHEVRPL